MQTRIAPIRSTLWLGFVLALCFTPLIVLLRWGFAGPIAWRLVLTLYVLVYSMLLIRWSGSRPIYAILPACALGALSFLVPRTWAFVMLALLSLGWVRSGICFQKRWFWAIGIEVLLGGGGALLVGAFTPQSNITWSLAIWMFSLVQALFFLFPYSRFNQRPQADPFERARQAAEQILRAQS